MYDLYRYMYAVCFSHVSKHILGNVFGIVWMRPKEKFGSEEVRSGKVMEGQGGGQTVRAGQSRCFPFRLGWI